MAGRDNVNFESENKNHNLDQKQAFVPKIWTSSDNLRKEMNSNTNMASSPKVSKKGQIIKVSRKKEANKELENMNFLVDSKSSVQSIKPKSGVLRQGSKQMIETNLVKNRNISQNLSAERAEREMPNFMESSDSSF